MIDFELEDIVEMELFLMDLIIEKKVEDGFIVFSKVENGLLN